MTPGEFKKRWESSEDGGGITYQEVAECAKTWGVCKTPKIRPMDHVLYTVLKHAQTVDAEDYKPDYSDKEE